MQERNGHAPGSAQPPQCGSTPELDLVLLCARWPQRPEDRELIQQHIAGPLDWPLFLQLVRHHRLAPLVSHTLQSNASDEPSPSLKAALGELRHLSILSAHQSLRCLVELRRLVQGLQAQNLSVRVLKGIPLAQSVFGDLNLRAPGDIDLLVDESSILEADRLLRGFGYRGIFRMDRFSPRRLAFYRSHWKDVTYTNPSTGIEVDLHWRCFRNSAMPGANLCSTSELNSVSFGGFRVDTLPRMESLLYLCVHGTLDGWLYLKSLVDVAAHVRGMSQADMDALATFADSYEILPELTAALILVRRYLQIDHWSPRLLPEADPTVAHILRYADRSLAKGAFLADRDTIPIATTMAFEFGLRRSLRYRSELLLRILFRARMWETIPLPDWLFGIYPFLSPFEWAIYRLRHVWAKPPSGSTLSV